MELDRASSKVPPAWDPANASRYSFRDWKSDMELWLLGTELVPTKQGGAIALQLSGEAREIARNIDKGRLRDGIAEADGAVRMTGAQYLIAELERKLGPQQQSKAIESLQSYFSFQKKRGELVDFVLSRFATVYNRASAEGGLTISQAGRAYKLMEVLGLQSHELLVFLGPFDGALPDTDDRYSDFIEHVRRYYQRNEQQKNTTYTGAVLEDADAEGYWHDEGWYEWEDAPHEDEEEIEEEFNHLGNPKEEDEMTPEDEEGCYLAYLAARRKMRYFSKGKGGKGGKSKSKSKDNGKGKFTPSYPAYKSGGKGSKHRNPTGRDGMVLRCSICGSQEHLRARCPRNQSSSGSSHPFQGKGKSSSTSTGQQTSTWTTWM
eukprot:6460615-Amphidinium_carterae.1